MTWQKLRKGVYATRDGYAETYKHDGLTWQAAPYWVLTIGGEKVTWNNGQSRARRFRTLADVKAYVALALDGVTA